MSVPFAHAVVDTYRLPIPLWLYLVAAGVAVAATFVVAARGVRREAGPQSLRASGLLGPWLALPRPMRMLIGGALEVASVVIWAAALGSLLVGPDDFIDSFGALWVWVVFWVGLGIVATLVGDLWAWLSPFAILARRLIGPLAGDPDLLGRYRYPERLGQWPAVTLLLAFSWIELVWEHGTEPRNVGILLGAYLMLNLAGPALVGIDAWNRNVELFAVLSGWLSRCAVTELRARPEQACEACLQMRDERPLRIDCAACFARAPAGERAIGLRAPFRGVLRGPDVPAGGLAFVLTALGTVMYDGLSTTAVWNDLAEWMGEIAPALDRSRSLLVPTVGLVGTCLLLAALVLLATAGDPRRARAYAPALVPIAAVYLVAHYFAYLLVIGQNAIAPASDPLARGWDLLGTAGFVTDPGIVGAREVWYVQIALIVAGHVAAVVAGARIAAARGPAARTRSEIPMAALMVAYTVLGLWILSTDLVV